MSDKTKILGNVERLRNNLKDGSFGLALVDAHDKNMPKAREASIKAVLQARLDQLRAVDDNPKA